MGGTAWAEWEGVGVSVGVCDDFCAEGGGGCAGGGGEGGEGGGEVCVGRGGGCVEGGVGGEGLLLIAIALL